MLDGGSAFQFHKGTIRTKRTCASHAFPLNFNSIKVQLEHTAYRLNSPQMRFQFHKGTIRTFGYKKYRQKLDNFNSIKVQLELISLICR